MDAVQHVDAVTRRVEAVGAGWVLSLGRVLYGRPREVWRAWGTPAALRQWWPMEDAPGAWAPGEGLVVEGVRHVIEHCEEPASVRLLVEEEETSFVAVDLAVDGGQTVLTLQHAVPGGVAGVSAAEADRLAARGVAWDRVLWRLARRLEEQRGETDDQPVREEEAAAASADLWAVAAVQAVGLAG